MQKRKLAAWGLGLASLGFVMGQKEPAQTPHVAKSPEWMSRPTPIPGQGVCWTEHKADGSDEYLCSKPEVPEQVQTIAQPELQVDAKTQQPKVATVDSTVPLDPACDADGACHPCGVRTADGVTENLDKYRERCGEEG